MFFLNFVLTKVSWVYSPGPSPGSTNRPLGLYLNSHKTIISDQMTDNRARGWCFTLNNYTEDDLQALRDYDIGDGYMIVGKEKGANGTPHLQGYMHFVNKKSFRQVKAILPEAHWEIAKGSVKQNFDYCSKDGDFEQFGRRPRMPEEKIKEAQDKKKEDIKRKWELVELGAFKDLPPENLAKYEYAHQKMKRKPANLTTLNNLWIYGPSGCGKSRLVRDFFPSIFNKKLDKWWCGYNNEEIVLLEDMDPKNCLSMDRDLKIICDHYPFNAEVKGGNLFIRPKAVIVTSQYSMLSCLKDADAEARAAIMRRFKQIHYPDVDVKAEVRTLYKNVFGSDPEEDPEPILLPGTDGEVDEFADLPPLESNELPLAPLQLPTLTAEDDEATQSQETYLENLRAAISQTQSVLASREVIDLSQDY